MTQPTYEKLENAFRDAMAVVNSLGYTPSGEYEEIFEDAKAVLSQLNGEYEEVA